MSHVFRTEEQGMAVDGLRRFLNAQVEPLFNKEYRDIYMPKDVIGRVMRQLADYGLVSGVIGVESGGMGIDWLTNAMLFEEIAACSADLSIAVLINSFGAAMLEKLASPELRERYLPGLLRGETFVSVAISEPDVGSNVLEVKTRARA